MAALYMVDNNLAPVMSEIYGDCELFLGTAASAEGITVFASSGDQNLSACDPTDASQNLAFHPMAASGLASSPCNAAAPLFIPPYA